MTNGCFSLSLTVKNLQESKDFYEKLGFTVFHGEMAHGFLIMKNGDTNIGLFQGMFDKNILTFNPGWSQNAEQLDSFTDIRKLQAEFKRSGLKIEKEINENSAGPASFTIIDPDGNPILFDQHV